EPVHPHHGGRAQGRPCGSRRAGRRGRLHAPSDRADHARPGHRHVPRGPGPDRRLDRDPHDRRRPAGLRPAGLGDDGVPDHLDDHHPALREALRHLRPPAVLPLRHRRLHPGLPGLRVRHDDVPARGLPGAAGHRRRRPDVAGAGHHRGHRAAAGAVEVPGLLHGRVRYVERPGPGHRWLPRRPRLPAGLRRLALDLPDQRAAGRAGPRRRLPGAAPAAPAPRAPHRLARGPRTGDVPGAAADRRRAGPDLGLGLRWRRPLLRRRRGRLRALPARRAVLRGGRAAPPPAVPEPQLRHRGHRQHRHGRRHVRRHPAAPPVPADRPGLQRHRGGTPDDPAGRRDHGRRDGLGHRDLEDRQVQDLPPGGDRVHGDRTAVHVLRRRGGHLGPDPRAVHGAARHRPGLQLPAGDPRRAERGLAAGDGRRHLVGHLLPPDGRHHRGHGVPLRPVHPAAPGHRRRRAGGGRRGPPRGPGAAERSAADRRPVRHLVHPGAARPPRAAVQGGVLRLHRPGVPHRRLRRRGRVLRVPVPAAARAEREVGHPGLAGRGRRQPGGPAPL
ncbi:MAG: Uncharacterized MFS-type transporter, partial [uncultured Blastococcus sp.]